MQQTGFTATTSTASDSYLPYVAMAYKRNKEKGPENNQGWLTADRAAMHKATVLPTKLHPEGDKLVDY